MATTNANTSIHILVVEDDAALRVILREAFEEEGIAVLEAADKAALFRNLETEPIDLITLDLGLGREDGLELAHQIRAKRNIPIVMITGRGAPIDRVTGLEHGADDYISKPFHIREVLLRIHNVLRRYKREEGGPKAREGRRYAFDRSVLDSAKREVRKADGTVLDLTDREFDLLELFLRHPARVLSRDEIPAEPARPAMVSARSDDRRARGTTAAQDRACRGSPNPHQERTRGGLRVHRRR